MFNGRERRHPSSESIADGAFNAPRIKALGRQQFLVVAMVNKPIGQTQHEYRPQGSVYLTASASATAGVQGFRTGATSTAENRMLLEGN